MTSVSVDADRFVTASQRRLPPQRHRRRSVLDWAVLLGVLIAVSWYGMTSTVVTLLGSDHTHTRSGIHEVPSMALVDFRRTDREFDTLGPTRPRAQAHAHLVLQRHHHDRNDATVQSIEAEAEDALGAGTLTSTASAAAMVDCGHGALTVPAPLATPARWRHMRCPNIPSGQVHRLERPPRT